MRRPEESVVSRDEVVERNEDELQKLLPPVEDLNPDTEKVKETLRSSSSKLVKMTDPNKLNQDFYT